MRMVRHHNPSKKRIARSVEVPECVRHDIGNGRIAKMTGAHSRMEVSIEALMEESRDLFLFRERRMSRIADDRAEECPMFLPK
jgi:hypothetical protein